MTVGAITHPVALAHDAGSGHPERPERLEAIRFFLNDAGLHDRLEWTAAEPAARELIELAHTGSHLDRLEQIDLMGGGRLDPDTRMGPKSLEAALRGSQATVDAADRVLTGAWDGAFVFMRPPGHHATADTAMGFCLTNHVAIAARWAVRRGRVDRVLIFDWDAHHGNGTQDILYEDPSVLYVSLHQYPWYPGTGAVDETGAGAGAGTTLNVPLPQGTGEDAYERVLDDVVMPAVRRFDPELVLVSAGYDAHVTDPLCMMGLRAGAFHRFTTRLTELGRGLVCVLEGGYDLDGLGWSVCATVSALLGEEPIGVPSEELTASVGTAEAHRWVERAAAVQSAAGR